MKKILVIEDDDILRENISELLEISGYDVKAAENGLTGVKMAENMIPDLIVCDIMMPELDGFGVLHVLSKKENLNHIPFIFLSAKSDKKDLRKGMGLGADDYLTKPFDDVELLEAIELRLLKFDNLANKTGGLDQNNKSLDQLINESPYTRYKPQSYIYHAGDSPLYLYFLSSGQAKITRLNENGKELILEIVEEGEIFGHHSIFQSTEYTDSAVATSESVVHKINKDEFLSHLEKDITGSLEVIKSLTSKVISYEKRLMDMAYESSKKRILISLNSFLDGSKETEISRSDLANLSGTTVETVVRTLTELKKDNILSIDKNDVTLKDEQAFKKLFSWL